MMLYTKVSDGCFLINVHALSESNMLFIHHGKRQLNQVLVYNFSTSKSMLQFKRSASYMSLFLCDPLLWWHCFSCIFLSALHNVNATVLTEYVTSQSLGENITPQNLVLH